MRQMNMFKSVKEESSWKDDYRLNLFVSLLFLAAVICFIINQLGTDFKPLTSSDIINMSGSFMLVLITFMYCLLTNRIAMETRKQTYSISKQNRIADIEKRLEKVYNPSYEILRTPSMSLTESILMISVPKYKKLCDIFETYSYLASKEVINQWYSTIEKNKKRRLEGLVIGKGHPPIVKQSLLHLIDKERKDLIAEHEKLVKSKK